MYKKIRKSLSGLKYRYKLMLFCIGLILVPVLLITAVYINQIATTIQKQSTNDAVMDLNKIKNMLSDNFMSVEELSDQIYFNNTLNKQLLNQYKNKGESADVYIDLIDPLITQNQYLNHTFIKNVAIYIRNPTFLTNGKNVIFADNSIQTTRWYMDCLSKGKQGNIIWSPNVSLSDAGDGTYTYSLYRCLNNYIGKPAGVLEIQLDESYLLDMIQNTNKRTLFFINDSGSIISSNSRDLLGKNSKEIGYLVKTFTGESGQYEYDIGPDRYMVLYDTITTNDLNYSWKIVSMVPLSYLLQDVNNAKRTGIIISLAALLALMGIIIVFSSSLTRRINHLAEKANMVIQGNFNIKVDVEGYDEIGQLGVSFNKMLSYLDNLFNEVYENKIKVQSYQIKQKEIELVALQNKINPHFLYNTLDAIRMHAIIGDNEEIGDMLIALSSLLRYSISNKEDIVTVREEMDHICNYINLMQIRFEDQLKFNISMDDSFNSCKVLKFILQPIVENTINHGIRMKKNRGTVTLSACREDNDLIITVCDDGQGMMPEQIDEINRKLNAGIEQQPAGNKGIGLSNVNDRIRLYYGSSYGISIESIFGEGTKVILRLPFIQEGENDDKGNVG